MKARVQSRNKRWLGADGRVFRRLYERGKTLEQIAEHFGVSRHQARHAASAILMLPPRVSGKPMRAKRAKARAKVLAYLRKRPQTVAELSARVSISSRETLRILEQLKKNGAVIRQGEHTHSIYKLTGRER